MKLLTIAVLLMSLCATGCDLAQLLGGGVCPGAEDSQGTMTANVDGEAYEACITVGSNDSGTLAVTGQDYQDGVVPIQLQVTVTAAAAGTFPLGGTEGSGRYSQSVDATYVTALDVAVGTVEIATLDDVGAAGTFSFEAIKGDDGEDRVAITDGAFEVTFE